MYEYANDRSCFDANNKECKTTAINYLRENTANIKSRMDKNRLKWT